MIEKVIKELRKKYEEAKKLSFVNDPVTYALYHTWKKYDTKPAIRMGGQDERTS